MCTIRECREINTASLTLKNQIQELIPVLCDELNNSPNSITEKEIKMMKKTCF